MVTLLKSWKSVRVLGTLGNNITSNCFKGTSGNVASRCYFRGSASLRLKQKTGTKTNDVLVWNLSMLFSRGISSSIDRSITLYHQYRCASSSSEYSDKIKCMLSYNIPLVKKLSQVIKDVMNEEAVSQLPIPDGKRNLEIYGRAKVRCANPLCGRTWFSRLAHADIDLRKQEVTKIWKQKCKTCGRKGPPSFVPAYFKGLVRPKIKRIFFASGSTEDHVIYGSPSHKSRLCEKCGYGEALCWTSTSKNKKKKKK